MGRRALINHAGFGRIATAVFCTFALSGCMSGGLSTSASDLKDSPIFSKSNSTPSADLVQRTKVLDGAVVIATPKGFCIDTTAQKDNPSGAFVPIGACAALTKNPSDPKPGKPAFLTASVLPIPAQAAVSPDGRGSRLQEATAFVESEAGRTALSRDGQAKSVTILKIKPNQDTLYVRVKDQSEGLPASLSDTTSRAFLELNGLLVTATVTSFVDEPFSEDQEDRLLRDFVAAIKSANSAASKGRGGLKSLLDRLRP